MNAEIDQLAHVFYLTIGVSVIVVTAILIYLCWLGSRIHRDVKRLLRRPEVPRNGDGKRIKERL